MPSLFCSIPCPLIRSAPPPPDCVKSLSQLSCRSPITPESAAASGMTIKASADTPLILGTRPSPTHCVRTAHRNNKRTGGAGLEKLVALPARTLISLLVALIELDLGEPPTG